MAPILKPTDLMREVRPERIEAYLRAHGRPEARLIRVEPLGAGVQEGTKARGYGCPLRVIYRERGVEKSLVLRTMGADGYGHDRRSDRIGDLALSFDLFNAMPQHVQALDLGAFAFDGSMVSIERGEPFLFTNYVEGELYAKDLKEMAGLPSVREQDLERARALARYLARLHSQRAPQEKYRRSLRDTIGSGEGIFGLIDGYPDRDAVVPADRLRALELAVLDWRWKLRAHEDRARRTHGDFHPFNLLFRAGTDFTVLDASRGGAGDPADDVACLSINYLFFALLEGEFSGALRSAWDTFFETYLELTGDRALLAVAAPFFAWRSLVLASPSWYPDVAPAVRDRILRFAENLLAGRPFTPERVDDLL